MILKVVLNISTRLYNHHYYVILEHFIILRRNLLLSEHSSSLWVITFCFKDKPHLFIHPSADGCSSPFLSPENP